MYACNSDRAQDLLLAKRAHTHTHNVLKQLRIIIRCPFTEIIKELTALMDRLSQSIGWQNGLLF